MFSVTFFRITFTSSWQMFLSALGAVILLMYLGHWQMTRAHEKKEMLSLAQGEALRAPLNWQSHDKMPLAYQSLAIKGHYLPTIWLLDNQHHEHQFGYDVLSPLLLADGAVILVDRGWIAADVTRLQLPEVNVPSGLQSLSGYAYYPSSKYWLLGPAYEAKTTAISVIEVIDTVFIGKILHKTVYPFIIRMHPNVSNGYIRQWPIVSMPPHRHIGYAIQWYALALLVIALFIGLNVKKTA